MGLIKAATGAISGALADQWLEAFEAGDMGDTTVMAPGIKLRRGDRRDSNYKGTAQVVSNGSKIIVNENQCMLLVDGGKIVSYTAEPGYYTVDNSTAPSVFNGQLGDSVKETWERFKFSGSTPLQQKIYFINMQEIKNIAFGTVNPVNYFDEFYNAELYLRAHGYFSIRITDPIKFYREAIPRDAQHVNVEDIHKLYLSEFLTAFQAAINQMSADHERISYVASQSQKLAQYMSTVLDDDWNDRRGMVIESVGINSISYDEDSKNLINLRNKGAMLSDATVREGYVQGSVAEGIKAAGSNSAGAAQAFMGMGIGMQASGGPMSAFSTTNQNQMQQQAAEKQAAKEEAAAQAAAAAAAGAWTCECGQQNTGKFCQNCGKPQPAPAETWTCECGQENGGNFCSNCGKPRPAAPSVCPKCGKEVEPGANFCPSCGEKLK